MGTAVRAILHLVQGDTCGGAALLVRADDLSGGEIVEAVPDRGQAGLLVSGFQPDDAACLADDLVQLPSAYAVACGRPPTHITCVPVGLDLHLVLLSCGEHPARQDIVDAGRRVLEDLIGTGHVTTVERQESARLAEMVRVMPIPFIFVDRQGQKVFANDSARALLGIGSAENRAEVIGPALSRLIKSTGGAAVRLALDDDGRGSASFTLEHRGRVQKVDTNWVERGPLCGRIWAFHDITAERELEDELRRLASTDFLTGALNRRAFELGFRSDIERAHQIGVPIALIMLDLDLFKQANDTHGHEAGDKILREVCRRAAAVLREGDRLARLGGEEFAVLMLDATLVQAESAAERIRRAIEVEPFDVGRPVVVTCSLGVAALRDAPDDRSSMMERADAALYRAKAAGRNRVHATA